MIWPSCADARLCRNRFFALTLIVPAPAVDFGADEKMLRAYGATVAGLLPDSQRYFDYHHTRIDSIDKVNKRELELGAAAMAALVYLVDQHEL